VNVDVRHVVVNPFNTSNLNRYANLLSDSGFYEDAVFYYERALLAEPDDIDTLYNIAYALEQLDRVEESQQYYEKAEQLESEEILVEPKETIPKTIPEITEKPQIPDWVRNNAEWWAQGAIGDNDFVSGIQYLIKEKIMQIPETAKAVTPGGTEGIPAWIKNNADWWSQGLISDDDFVKGIQYLVEQGIIKV